MKPLTAEKIASTFTRHGPLGLKQAMIRHRWNYERRQGMWTAIIKGYMNAERNQARSMDQGLPTRDTAQRQKVLPNGMYESQ